MFTLAPSTGRLKNQQPTAGERGVWTDAEGEIMRL